MRSQRFSNKHKGFYLPDPFAPRRRRVTSFIESLLATTIFRCWHILLFYGLWSTFIVLLNVNGYKFVLKDTLLKVVGTALGFVTSVRASTSFDRYNEGRKLWAQIIQSSRMFARTVWFHVPEPTEEELKGRSLIEKKSVINLLEAFAVSVKHYLRGEDGIYYEDLYYLIKFLPAFSHMEDEHDSIEDLKTPEFSPPSPYLQTNNPSWEDAPKSPYSPPGLPPPVTSYAQRNVNVMQHRPHRAAAANTHNLTLGNMKKDSEKILLSKEDEKFLLSAHHPPNWGLFDIFPFSLIRRALIKRSKGRTDRSKMRAKLRKRTATHHIPLDITLYLSSWIAANQRRKTADPPTNSQLYSHLSMLVNCLTSLERIVTTPIPFSYSVHLWVVITLYCIFLPLQIYKAMKWLTIPATIICAFFFFGFLVAGEEIENPFGYDKNDLDIDHYTNIIRNELKAITSAPPPDPEHWVFVAENDLLFTANKDERTAPDEWLMRGAAHMQHSLSTMRG